MVVYYNPHYPAYTSLAVLKGTVLHSVLFSSEYWCHVSLHIFLSIWFWYKRHEYNLESFTMPADAFKLTLTLNTFLLVYFSSQCYKRYWDIYNNTQSIDESLKLFVRQLDTFLWQKSVRRHVKIAIKYMLAAIFLFYFVLSDGGRIDQEEWDFMIERGLLTQEEITYLRGPRNAAIKGVVLTSWSVRCVQSAMRTEEISKLFSPPERGAYIGRIDKEAVSVNQCMRNISDLLAMPVPFAYFHLLSLIMVMNFCIANWYLVVTYYTPWTILPFSVTVLVFLGIRSVSASLADPFQAESGDKLQCAMPALAFLNNAYHNAVALVETIEDHHPHPEPRCELDEDFLSSEQHLSEAHNNGENKVIKPGNTITALQKTFSCHKRLCVGEQAHVAFQWKSSQVGGAYVEGWIKGIRHKIMNATDFEKEGLLDEPAAAPPAEEKAPELTPEQIQIIAAIEKLADQQRALCTVVNRIINSEQDDDAFAVLPDSKVTEPLLSSATSPFTSATPTAVAESGEKPAKAKMAKAKSKPAAKKFGKPMPPAG